jgi:drug/metabolite transporter (DMT)-like permease
MQTAGILCGLGAATAISISYIFSRLFIMRSGRSPIQLLALGHVLMAGLSLLLLPFVYRQAIVPWTEVALANLGVGAFYFLAQACLFYVLKKASASNVAPLLGLKITLSALIGIVLGNSLQPLQWGSVLLTAIAALLLRNSKEGVTFKLIAMVLLTCSLYCGSDYSIKYLVATLGTETTPQTVVLAVVYSYILCGLFSLAFIKEIHRSTRHDWWAAVGYALPWFCGMLFLFGAFATVGVVFGVILQSTRGVISVMMAMGLAAFGVSFAEEKCSVQTRTRQLAAALLMVAAIYLFNEQKADAKPVEVPSAADQVSAPPDQPPSP